MSILVERRIELARIVEAPPFVRTTMLDDDTMRDRFGALLYILHLFSTFRGQAPKVLQEKNNDDIRTGGQQLNCDAMKKRNKIMIRSFARQNIARFLAGKKPIAAPSLLLLCGGCFSNALSSPPSALLHGPDTNPIFCCKKQNKTHTQPGHFHEARYSALSLICGWRLAAGGDGARSSRRAGFVRHC